MRTLIALLALVAALALGVPAAFATFATDSSSDGLTVTVSLSDTAKAGEPFTVAESIENTTAKPKLVRVTQTLTGPSGTLLSFSYPLFVRANTSLSFNLTFRFPFPKAPSGIYSLTLRANTASATAMTKVS